MKQTSVLYIRKQKGLFKASYEKEQCNDVALLYVRNRSSALKKLMKALPYENILIAHNCKDDDLVVRRKNIFRSYTLDTVLPVTEEICRKTAQKFGLKIPFAEVYIEADPAVACKLLTGIQSLSRIFTVVSEEAPLNNAYDEIYFKHGTIIRHISGYCNKLTHEAIIIRCDTKYSDWEFEAPVINFTLQREQKNRTVNVPDIYIKDEKINGFLDFWGGKSGILLYEFLGEIPSQNAVVDINSCADEIFLLDTDKN